jgi:hypothetical protein
MSGRQVMLKGEEVRQGEWPSQSHDGRACQNAVYAGVSEWLVAHGG